MNEKWPSNRIEGVTLTFIDLRSLLLGEFVPLKDAIIGSRFAYSSSILLVILAIYYASNP